MVVFGGDSGYTFGTMAKRADTAVDVDAGAFDVAAFDLDGVVTRTAAVHAAAWKPIGALADAFQISLTGIGVRPG